MVYVTTGTVVNKNESKNKTPLVTGATNAPKSPSLGYGGSNYATANTSGRQSITSNQAKIKNDDSYRQSEIARTLATITNRQNQGLDTSAQQKYLNVNLGYQSAMGQAAANTQAQPAAQNNFAIPGSRTEQTLGSINDWINKQGQFQFEMPDSFTYDPSTDPAYQSQLAEAKKNVVNQQADTNAGLRATGQGKSSWSETVANQIGTSAMESIANNLVPQLMQQAYQRYSDEANRNLQVQQMNYGVGQDAIGNLGSLYGLQNQEYFQNPLAEAQVTGNYLPTAARDAINNLLSLKQQAETKGISAEERSNLSKQADFIRSQLTSMGIDASQYGADVNYNTASQAQAGIRTLAGQQTDLASRQANLDAALQYANLTGRLMTPQTDWTGYARQATNPETPLTMAGQQQQFDQGQQAWNNEFTLEQFAYQKARDAIGDQQWQMQFDENVRQYGLNYAMEDLAQRNQMAYQQAQIAISQDENARAWLAYGDGMNQTTSPSYSGVTANQAYESIYDQFVDEKTGKIPSNASTKNSIYQQVMSMGLPDGQDTQVMTMLGLTQSDISKYDKQYGVSSGNSNSSTTFTSPSGGAYSNYFKAEKDSKANPKNYATASSAVSRALSTLGKPAEWLAPTLELVARESSFNPNAKNPKSSAAGLFQFLDATRKNYGGSSVDWSDPYQQALKGLQYIEDRYGNPVKALQFWDKNNWY